MRDAAPAHIGDVEQTIDTAQVDERTVFGDVLDDAIQNRALVEAFKRLLFEHGAFFFQERTTRQDDVATFLVELDDFEAIFLVDEFVEVARRTEFDLATRQEGAHADIDGETTFDAAHDGAFDRFIAFSDLGNFFPDHEFIGFFLAQYAKAVFVFRRFDIDIDGVANFHGQFPIGAFELIFGHLSLGFISNIDDDEVAYEIDNFTADDFTFTYYRCLRLLELGKKRLKTFHFLGHNGLQQQKRKKNCHGYKGHPSSARNLDAHAKRVRRA